MLLMFSISIDNLSRIIRSRCAVSSHSSGRGTLISFTQNKGQLEGKIRGFHHCRANSIKSFFQGKNSEKYTDMSCWKQIIIYQVPALNVSPRNPILLFGMAKWTKELTLIYSKHSTALQTENIFYHSDGETIYTVYCRLQFWLLVYHCIKMDPHSPHPPSCSPLLPQYLFGDLLDSHQGKNDMSVAWNFLVYWRHSSLET